MKAVHVDVRVNPIQYEVYMGTDLLDRMAQDLQEKPLAKRYAVLSDDRVSGLYGKKMMESLEKRGMKAQLFTFPQGEASKNRKEKEHLEDAMLAAGFGRDSAVIALGGGVVGDLAGFVAATYMRGIPVLQVPTTTLAMADSAIGSKTAVDVPYGKNLIGAFHSPVAVYMDMGFLPSLDERNYFAGLVELIKHSFIRMPALQDFLSEHRDTVCLRQGEDYFAVMETLFYQNSAVKNEIVSRDQQESNLRKVLNYGHTLGHSVEMASHFERIHGECVAIGIAFAAYLSWQLGYCEEEWAQKQVQLLQEYHQDTRIPEGLTTEQLIQGMKTDKKVRDGKTEWILLAGPGKLVQRPDGAYGIPVEEDILRECLERFRKWQK